MTEPGSAAASVTHFVDDDWEPLCKDATTVDFMWAFYDAQITCPRCCAKLANEFPGRGSADG